VLRPIHRAARPGSRRRDGSGRCSPAGPGHIVLPRGLGWTGPTDYDLDDPLDAAVLYERVLVDAVRAQEVTRLLAAGRLRLLWSRPFLPAKVRQLWESRFPGLGPAV
jgi:hypothetical protein